MKTQVLSIVFSSLFIVNCQAPEHSGISYREVLVYKMSVGIASLEGWDNPRSLVHRLHNPGALVFTYQKGAAQHKSGYAKFRTDEEGQEALVRDLNAKLDSGLNPERIAKRWAKDGNTYWNKLKEKLGDCYIQ